MSAATEMKVTAVAPWFGSNRMLSRVVGEELSACSWVGVVFAGGMCELRHLKARTINVNDIHRHVINLAGVMGDPDLGPQLYRRVRRRVFHPDELAEAQEFCRRIDRDMDSGGIFPPNFPLGLNRTRSDDGKLDWATAYFTVAWMGRHAIAGTPAEFTGGISTRWNANGGDSAAHYWGAVDSIAAWRRILRRCNFTKLDAFEFLARCKDEKGHGIYCDPPFPGPGDGYTHRFTEAQHRRLAKTLAGYERARVACRFYDHPLIREIYPEGTWTWRRLVGRKQTNEDAPEVLVIGGGQ